MALEELARFEPEDSDLQGSRLVVVAKAPKATVDSDLPAKGSFYGSDNGAFGRVLVARRVVRNDAQYPGFARVWLTYKTLSSEEWLYSHLNKAVLLRGAKARQQGLSVHDFPSWGYVQGRDYSGSGTRYWHITKGHPAKWFPQPDLQVHGYTDTPGTFIDPFVDKAMAVNLTAMSNFPPGLQIEGQVVMLGMESQPVPGTKAIWQVDYSFTKKNFDTTCESNSSVMTPVWVGDDITGFKRVETWVNDGGLRYTFLLTGSADFGPINGMLSGGWPQ